MRVIAGVARGRPLVGPVGSRTRPTSDKVKGALFSMLEVLLAAERPGSPSAPTAAEPGSLELWDGLTVLDLYAGTGALGIEALSRGATWCDFVESDARARRTIERNLAVTGLASRGRIIGLDAAHVVHGSARASLHAPYGVVVLDPPYADPTVGDVVGALAQQQGLLLPGALVAVEHSRRLTLADWYPATDVASEATAAHPIGLKRAREKRYGETLLSIYRLTSGDAGEGNADGDHGDLSGEL